MDEGDRRDIVPEEEARVTLTEAIGLANSQSVGGERSATAMECSSAGVVTTCKVWPLSSPSREHEDAADLSPDSHDFEAVRTENILKCDKSTPGYADSDSEMEGKTSECSSESESEASTLTDLSCDEFHTGGLADSRGRSSIPSKRKFALKVEHVSFAEVVRYLTGYLESELSRSSGPSRMQHLAEISREKAKSQENDNSPNKKLQESAAPMQHGLCNHVVHYIRRKDRKRSVRWEGKYVRTGSSDILESKRRKILFTQSRIDLNSPAATPADFKMETQDANPSRAGTILQEKTDFFPASSTKRRPDLTALGLNGFHDIFNPTQIVCMYTKGSAPENAIEMVFLHVQGMALFIGVGLPHALVLLQGDGIVKVKEMQESTWSELWMETKMNEYKLILLDSSSWSNMSQSGTGEQEVSDRLEMLSSEEAAEKFGVGVEGMHFYKYGGFHRNRTQDTPRSPHWVKLFYEFLTHSDHAGNDTSQGNSEVAIIKEKLTDPLMSDLDAKLPGLNLDECISQQNGGATRVDQGPDENRDQPLQLTVIVYLDHSKCQYFSPSDGIKFQVTEQTDSGLSSLIDPNSCASVESIKDASTDFELTPTVTITFLYYTNPESGGSKILKTKLDVHYFVDSKIQDQNIFGWYHDELRFSFTCKQPNNVSREVPGHDPDEILSQNEYRSADRSQSKESSFLTLTGKGRRYKIFGGHRTFASLEYVRDSRKETTVGGSSKQDAGTKITARCLMQNFAIRDVGRRYALAYEATIFPPLDLFSLWDNIDRSFLHSTGIMSPVPIKVQGHWIVREDPSSANGIASTGDTSSEFCEYELSCQRNLIRHEKKEVPVEKPTKKSRFSRSSIKGKDSDELSTEVCVDTMIIQQVLRKVFLINHTFSHMQGLKKPYPYVWNMVGQPEAPCPKPVDQLIS